MGRGLCGVKYLRRISTRRLLALCAATVAAGVGVTALAMAATGGGPKPAAEPLPVAVHDALAAPTVQGVSARIKFTNHLISGSDVQGADPILSGASGRLWATSDGHFRLELQADSNSEGATSDSQVLSDGHSAWVYDSGSNTVFEGKLPAGHDGKDGSGSANEQPPSLARIKKGIAKLADHALLSGAQPTDVAGQPAYTVRVEPKRDGGLLGGAELAWDAVHGTPLRVALYAKGDSSPVIELKVTDISYGPVPSSVFDISPPPDAQVTNVSPPAHREGGRRDSAPVTGLRDVQKQLSFPVAAPETLAGRPQNEVRLIESNKDAGVLVTYGEGLGGIAVIERPADSGQSSSASGGDHGQLSLPKVSVNGAQGEELDTALGTMIRFQRNGVEYTVIASAPPATVQTAARAL
jgi:outer membrane lipoprotein-sorting protein